MKNIAHTFFCTGRERVKKAVEEISLWRESRSTGAPIEDIRFERWYRETVHYRANTPREYFTAFEHMIEVDPFKFFKLGPGIKGYEPVDGFKQYTPPNRDFDNCSVYSFFRVVEDPWSKDLVINEMGCDDRLFVATNNSKDATMIALKFS